jgi:hypothetical protein
MYKCVKSKSGQSLYYKDGKRIAKSKIPVDKLNLINCSPKMQQINREELRSIVVEIFDDFANESYFKEIVNSKLKQLEIMIEENILSYDMMILSISPFPSYIDRGASKYIDDFLDDNKSLSTKLKNVVEGENKPRKNRVAPMTSGRRK